MARNAGSGHRGCVDLEARTHRPRAARRRGAHLPADPDEPPYGPSKLRRGLASRRPIRYAGRSHRRCSSGQRGNDLSQSATSTVTPSTRTGHALIARPRWNSSTTRPTQPARRTPTRFTESDVPYTSCISDQLWRIASDVSPPKRLIIGFEVSFTRVYAWATTGLLATRLTRLRRFAEPSSHSRPADLASEAV